MPLRWTALLLLAGCFSKPPPPEPFVRCGDQGLDEAVRYKFDTMSVNLDLASAQDRCNDFGLELLSINTEEEYLALLPQIVQRTQSGRIYVGTNDIEVEDTFVGTDACPAYLFFTAGEPDGMRLENCVAIDIDGLLFDGPCNQPSGAFAAVRHVACELPRWPNRACFEAAQMHGELTFDPAPRTLDEAKAFCGADRRVIEIESSAELDAARALANGATFWLGARQSEHTWSRESAIKCGQIMPWRVGEPTFARGECAVHAADGAEVRACSDLAATICEGVAAE
jgi:hypothetical protein